MAKVTGGVQLPDDAVSMGYVQVRPYDWQQVFYSPANNFKGTEGQFVQAGLAYRFTQSNGVRNVVLTTLHERA